MSACASTIPAPPITQRAHDLAREADQLAQYTRYSELLPDAAPSREELALALHQTAKVLRELAVLVEDLSARSLPR